jgi:hypothetical protein
MIVNGATLRLSTNAALIDWKLRLFGLHLLQQEIALHLAMWAPFLPPSSLSDIVCEQETASPVSIELGMPLGIPVVYLSLMYLTFVSQKRASPDASRSVRSVTPEELEKALLDPASAFEKPEDVLENVLLSREQKAEILRRWEYNASEEAVALEEGMPGEENGILRDILIALGKIVGPIDVEHTAPTKQHGLSRKAVGMPDPLK